MKLVECVPNFSEGRDRVVIEDICGAIRAVDGIDLRDVDPGADTNRVVVTFFGPPEAVLEAAFRGVAKAAERIDMARHSGAHPRMGATDVCPFVPVEGVTMADCAELARRLGQRVGDELAIPVYLYEAAATSPERRSLANIRKGEYEGLAARLADPAWRPDFGPAHLNVRSGATVIGAREFLIAYNVNLNSRAKDHATDLAFELREKGRSARRGQVRPFYYKGELVKHAAGRFACGSCEAILGSAEVLFSHTEREHGFDYRALARLHDQDPDHLEGQSALKPGKFAHCRAIGWEVPQYDRAQISINLTDWNVTPPHVVLEEARRLAAERGLVVTGSEVVGLIPFGAMRAAGRFYLAQQGRSTGVPAEDLLRTAAQSMGLSDVAPFAIADKVIGLPRPGALVSKRTDELVHEVSRDSPAPGGGSVAALAGALGAALATMVANLVIGKPKDAAKEAELRALADEGQRIKDALLVAVDADTDAFSGYMAALRLPKHTPAEQAARKAAMQAGLVEAVRVPLGTAEASLRAIELCRSAAALGNPASASDAGVGAQMGLCGVTGGVLNVLINLRQIADAAYVAEMRARCAALEASARTACDETMSKVRSLIG